MEMVVQGRIAERTGADTTNLFEPFLGLEPEKFRELASSVLVMIPHRPSEGISAALYRNAGYWAMNGTEIATVSDQFDGFIEMTRNGMVRTFLRYVKDKPHVKYCVMIDSDESVMFDAPYRLAQWGKDIVSGIVCSLSHNKGGVFACITAQDRHGKARFPSVQKTGKLPASGLREISSAGTGLLCVHKRVFEKMMDADDPPFSIPEEVRKECMRTGTLRLGEDMAFSERAKEHGFKIYVDFSVRAIHYKQVAIEWPSKNIDPTLDARKWTVSEEDYVHE